MRLFDLFKSNPIKKKILAIKRDSKMIVSNSCNEKYWIDWFGAYQINPEHLSFWICVMSDDMKMKLKSDNELYKKLRYLLEKHNYPLEARDEVSFSFESQQTVDRESRGSWHVHLQ